MIIPNMAIKTITIVYLTSACRGCLHCISSLCLPWIEMTCICMKVTMYTVYLPRNFGYIGASEGPWDILVAVIKYLYMHMYCCLV